MRARDEQTTPLEERLRRAAPPLRPADPARVNAALGRLAAAGAPLPLRAAPLFARHLGRVAAGLVLTLGLAGALLLRPRPQQDASGAAAMPDVATFGDLAELMQSQDLAHALAGEAANLTDDLANLTDTLNQSTLEILF